MPGDYYVRWYSGLHRRLQLCPWSVQMQSQVGGGGLLTPFLSYTVAAGNEFPSGDHLLVKESTAFSQLALENRILKLYKHAFFLYIKWSWVVGPATGTFCGMHLAWSIFFHILHRTGLSQASQRVSAVLGPQLWNASAPFNVCSVIMEFLQVFLLNCEHDVEPSQ